MTRTLRVRLGAGLLVGAAALSLAGCSQTATVPAANMEKSVADFVSKNTKATAKDVKCPDSTDAEVGVKVDCTFTAQDGDYVAHVEITKVDGTAVLYNISTETK